jgi:hypothetical protein
MDAAIKIQLSRPYSDRLASSQRWLAEMSLLLFLLLAPHTLHAQEILLSGPPSTSKEKRCPVFQF